MPRAEIASQRLVYDDMVKKLRLQIHELPMQLSHLNGHVLVSDSKDIKLNSEERQEGHSSWHNSVKQYTTSKPLPKNRERRPCYISRMDIKNAHKTFPSMCVPCGEFNLAGSNISLPGNLDLSGKVALITGARVNLGYHAALRLLRCGLLSLHQPVTQGMHSLATGMRWTLKSGRRN